MLKIDKLLREAKEQLNHNRERAIGLCREAHQLIVEERENGEGYSTSLYIKYIQVVAIIASAYIKEGVPTKTLNTIDVSGVLNDLKWDKSTISSLYPILLAQASAYYRLGKIKHAYTSCKRAGVALENSPITPSLKTLESLRKFENKIQSEMRF